ncbi:MAG: class I SAM-dependent methyltransferase, partial [Alphaproteobacteria bacterium]|nr:class I SAM-dependent methyltransferase [Alphaproteobacteria bacterium]
MPSEQNSWTSDLFVPVGHFYSPTVNPEEVSVRWGDICDRRRKTLPGIDLCEADQLDWLGCIAAFYDDLPFADQPVDGLRYGYANDQFGFGDAAVLFGMLRHLRPKRVVEVGSGYSSTVMLDTNDRFLDQSIAFTFIDPFPGRLYELSGKKSLAAHTVIESPVQSVPADVFSVLQPDDILFIDSSHVLKTGSDVAYLLFEVLPVLADGVIVHVHDIHYPFEYPEQWVIEDNRSWNEVYAIRAFLQYNNEFSILYFNSYMAI